MNKSCLAGAIVGCSFLAMLFFHTSLDAFAFTMLNILALHLLFKEF